MNPYNFPKTHARLRSTAATARRSENIGRLIKEMGERSMSSEEMGLFLNFSSSSGTRKYLKDLKEALLIEIEKYINGTALFLGTPIYRRICTDDRLTAYLDFINPGHTAQAEPLKTKVLPEKADRHFHVMKDDTHYAIRVSRNPAQRDPLVAALFGAPKVRPSLLGEEP